MINVKTCLSNCLYVDVATLQTYFIFSTNSLEQKLSLPPLVQSFSWFLSLTQKSITNLKPIFLYFSYFLSD